MKKFVAAALVVILSFSLFGMTLDKKWEVKRELKINADPEMVHSFVADLRTWPDWTAWSRERDPECVFTYSGPDFGEGMRYSWEGEELGKGHLTLTSASVEEGVTFDLVFGVTKGEGDLAQGIFTYQDVDGETLVTWTFFGEISGALGGWFALFMDTLAGAEFEKGLLGLQTQCEIGLGAKLEEEDASSTEG
jgi:hypothetical protein